MKSIDQKISPILDMNLAHIQKLNLKLYHHYIDLLRLYAYASGKKTIKNSLRKRSADDERRLLWSVESMREQIRKIENEIKIFIEKYL